MTAAFMVERPRIHAAVVLGGRVKAIRAAPADAYGMLADADIEIARVFRNTTPVQAPHVATYRYHTYADQPPLIMGISTFFRPNLGERVVVWAGGFDGMLSTLDIEPNLVASFEWLRGLLRGLPASDVRILGADEDARGRQLKLYDELIAWAEKSVSD